MAGDAEKMGVLSLCLEDILVNNIEPDDKVKSVHNVIVQEMMEDLRTSLPHQHPMFKDCQVEMFGSVANNTKVDEMDEYDFNVIIKCPFDPSTTRLQFKNNIFMKLQSLIQLI